MDRSINIIIGGDVAPTDRNLEAFTQGRIEEIVDFSVLDLFQKADVSFINLECPLTDDLTTPIKKSGPNIHAPTATVNGLKALRPTIIGLCNNHICDYGQTGLNSTLNVLQTQGLAYVGAGETTDSCVWAYIAQKNGVQVGLYVCAEHEFSIPGPHQGGVNPYDPLESYDHVRSMRKECDYLIVIYHGGIEYFPHASPMMQKRLRKFVSAGADLVLCQHNHCIAEQEIYKDSTILYGQGNFIFHGGPYQKNWREGLLVAVSGSPDAGFSVHYIGIKKSGDVVALCSEQEQSKLLDSLYKRSAISNERRKELFEEFCRFNKYNYLYNLSCMRRYLAALDRRTGNLLLRIIQSKASRKNALNCIQCESHAEVCQEILRDYE